jgi:hypothetical protein
MSKEKRNVLLVCDNYSYGKSNDKNGAILFYTHTEAQQEIEDYRKAYSGHEHNIQAYEIVREIPITFTRKKFTLEP